MKSLRMAILGAAIGLTGCTKMDQYFPDGTVSEVDGVAYLVRPLQPGTYQALINEPSKHMTTTKDARHYARHVRAIEQVTGCRVNRDSIERAADTTIAAVDC